VHDTNADAAAAVARRHGVESIAAFQAALAWPGVDAVVVATPHADHFSQALAALEAGKHVLCEKPLTIEPDDARLLALRADELRLRLGTGLNHRFYPPVVDALELAAAWQIGRVEGVRAEIGHKASPEFLGSWHTDVARSGGGTLIDNGPWPSRVTAARASACRSVARSRPTPSSATSTRGSPSSGLPGTSRRAT
jgi:predicted dehydrogenase